MLSKVDCNLTVGLERSMRWGKLSINTSYSTLFYGFPESNKTRKFNLSPLCAARDGDSVSSRNLEYVVECTLAVFLNLTRHEELFFVIHKYLSLANQVFVFVVPRDRVGRLSNLPPNYSQWMNEMNRAWLISWLTPPPLRFWRVT